MPREYRRIGQYEKEIIKLKQCQDAESHMINALPKVFSQY